MTCQNKRKGMHGMKNKRIVNIVCVMLVLVCVAAILIPFGTSSRIQWEDESGASVKDGICY